MDAGKSEVYGNLCSKNIDFLQIPKIPSSITIVIISMVLVLFSGGQDSNSGFCR